MKELVRAIVAITAIFGPFIGVFLLAVRLDEVIGGWAAPILMGGLLLLTGWYYPMLLRWKYIRKFMIDYVEKY